MKKIFSTKPGFTLLEILLVVAAIAILAGIVILAINPQKQLADTRNSERSVDVNTILNGVYQYAIDNDGILPTTIDATATEICKTDETTCAGLVDLSVLTDNGTYLTAIPIDPQGGIDPAGVGYTIMENANGRITVSAPNAENTAIITATR